MQKNTIFPLSLVPVMLLLFLNCAKAKEEAANPSVPSSPEAPKEPATTSVPPSPVAPKEPATTSVPPSPEAPKEPATTLVPPSVPLSPEAPKDPATPSVPPSPEALKEPATSPVPPSPEALKEPALSQMSNLKQLSKFYMEELNWMKKDMTEGVLHWSLADFINGIEALEKEWKDKKPSCFDTVDTAKDGIKSAGAEGEACLKNLEKTVLKATSVTEGVKTMEEADMAVNEMVAYDDSKEEKIKECKKIAMKMLPFYNNEKKKIEECIKQ